MTMNRTTTRSKRAIHTAPVHLKHAAKIVKVTKRSRLWCEIATCAGTAYETHLAVLTVVTILWVIVDVVLVIFGRQDEV